MNAVERLPKYFPTSRFQPIDMSLDQYLDKCSEIKDFDLVPKEKLEFKKPHLCSRELEEKRKIVKTSYENEFSILERRKLKRVNATDLSTINPDFMQKKAKFPEPEVKFDLGAKPPQDKVPRKTEIKRSSTIKPAANGFRIVFVDFKKLHVTEDLNGPFVDKVTLFGVKRGNYKFTNPFFGEHLDVSIIYKKTSQIKASVDFSKSKDCFFVTFSPRHQGEHVITIKVFGKHKHTYSFWVFLVPKNSELRCSMKSPGEIGSNRITEEPTKSPEDFTESRLSCSFSKKGLFNKNLNSSGSSTNSGNSSL